MISVARGVAIMAAVAAAAGCAGVPWLLGEPLDDRQVIPPTSRAETVADHRLKLDQAQRRGEKLVEIGELAALEERGALHTSDRNRFVELLKERARDWAVLRRPIALAQDLRHIVALDPGRQRALAPALRNAERSAGDLWLALGENSRAEEEYRLAERLGADRMVYRLRAAWGASPSDLDAEILERALADLPERALAPFTIAYLEGGGDNARLLRRAWIASRTYGPPELQIRLASMQFVDAFDPDAPSPSPVPSLGATFRTRGGANPAGVTVIQPAADDRLFTGPTLARVLFPMVDAFPDLMAPGPRSREWADRLVAEDPTSPDSLEVAALIDARAGRIDGAARKLGDLVFYSPDRAGAYARAARVWEHSDQDRRACLAWERATRYGSVDDPRWCDLLACVVRVPASGNSEIVRRYIQGRAPALACVTDGAATPSTARGRMDGQAGQDGQGGQGGQGGQDGKDDGTDSAPPLPSNPPD